MQANYPPRFEREHGCTEAEWLRWLPGAVGPHALDLPAPGRARVVIGAGALQLDWTALEPRRIAQVSFPRMRVRFVFESVADDERVAFMRHFDLYMQRGGG